MRIIFSLFLFCGLSFGDDDFSPLGLTAIWDTTTAAGILNGGGTWDSLLSNWNYDGVGTANSQFCQGCNVVFGGAGSTGAAGTVTVTGTQRINSFLFDATPNYVLTGGELSCVNSGPSCTYRANQPGTIGSLISGAKGLIKEGPGNLTLTADNTFTGIVDINAGTLTLSSPHLNTYRGGQININGASTLSVIDSGGAHEYDFPTQTFNFNNVGGGTINTGSPNLNWVQRGVWTFSTNGGARNNISGVAPLNMNAVPGGLIFSVIPGLDVISDLDVTIPLINSMAAVTKTGGGILRLMANSTYTGPLIISAGTLSLGDGIVTGNIIPAAKTIINDGTLIYNTPSTTNHSGIISGTGRTIKSGTGTLSVSGANTFLGGLTVSQGTWAQSHNSASGPGTVNLGDANTGSNNISWTFHGGSNTANPIIVNNLGTGTVTIGTNSAPFTDYSGPIILNRATNFRDVTGNRTTFTGQISGNPGTITIISGRVIFDNGTNNFVGNLIVSGGEYQNNHPTALPPTTNVTLFSGAKFGLWNGLTNPIGSINSTWANSKIEITYGYACTLSIGNNNADGDFAGVIGDGANILSLIKNGTGTQILSGNNTYSGGTNINGGTIKAGSTTAFGTGGITVNSGGTLDCANFAITNTIAVNGGTVINCLGRVTFLSGTSTYRVPNSKPNLRYLIVAGGGGGGGEGGWGVAGGGGGAGGMLMGTKSFSGGSTQTITVGAGGPAGSLLTQFNGENSSIGSDIAYGGGGGQLGSGNSYTGGNSGGSGGGTLGTNNNCTPGPCTSAGGAGIAGQGFDGGAGAGVIGSDPISGGGGGGAGGVGANGSVDPIYASGGVGRSDDISGSPVTYATGGNGGNFEYGANGANGAANTGNGGGGGDGNEWGPGDIRGGDGGSGIVIIWPQ